MSIISEDKKIIIAKNIFILHGINIAHAIELAPKMTIIKDGPDMNIEGFGGTNIYKKTNIKKYILKGILNVEFPFIRIEGNIEDIKSSKIKNTQSSHKCSTRSSLVVIFDDENYQKYYKKYVSENVKNLRKIIIKLVENITEHRIYGESTYEYLNFLVGLIRVVSNIATKNEFILPQSFRKKHSVMLRSLLLKSNNNNKNEEDDNITLGPRKHKKNLEVKSVEIMFW